MKKDYCLWWTSEEEDQELMDGDFVLVDQKERNREFI